jgi:hypothetical protein
MSKLREVPNSRESRMDTKERRLLLGEKLVLIDVTSTCAATAPAS